MLWGRGRGVNAVAVANKLNLCLIKMSALPFTQRLMVEEEVIDGQKIASLSFYLIFYFIS